MTYKQILENNRISTRRDKGIKISQQTKLQRPPSTCKRPHPQQRTLHACMHKTGKRTLLASSEVGSLGGLHLSAYRAPWLRLRGKASTELELAWRGTVFFEDSLRSSLAAASAIPVALQLLRSIERRRRGSRRRKDREVLSPSTPEQERA